MSRAGRASWNQFPPPPPSGAFAKVGPPPGAPSYAQKTMPECSIPGCKDESIRSDLGTNYCLEHTKRYELFIMGVMPSAGSVMTEAMFAMFDYLMEEIDRLNTELEMYRITKKYTGEDADVSPDSPDARHRYARKSGKPSRRFKGIR